MDGGTATSAHLLEPADVSEAATMLRQANDAHRAIVVRGHGTKERWGTPASRVDAVLSMARLNEPIEHCAGDLTVTAPAGVSLAEINAHLAREGQWLPLDPLAGGHSSAGGLLATNDSGPRRIRHGAPRDLVIGIECLLPDGRRARAGGRVVKNVAGYDLCRLLCGSFGTLAVITSATFKLSPLPPASRTVVIEVPDADVLAKLSRAIGAAPVVPSALEIDCASDAPGLRLLVRFETTAAAADVQASQVTALAQQHGSEGRLLHGGREDAVWAMHAAGLAQDTGALLRVSVLPMAVASTVSWIATRASADGLRWRLGGRVPLGALVLRLDGDGAAIGRCAAALREQVTAAAGHVALLSRPSDPGDAVPAWDEVGSAARVMRAVKHQFDPNGTLCPGGGPAGLS